ncbi:hypothetical protein [Haloprofundus salinisoli]|uniref:hypothetical protein n=1 Tax=Haloprofundus salinisoli TaxID=2876193 RepID=UPI001CCB7C7B|nr:hypothetical protein [Haloprofundus salinisoli]
MDIDELLEGYTGRTRAELTAHLDRPEDMVNLLADAESDALPEDFFTEVTNVRLHSDTVLLSLVDRQLKHLRYTEEVEQPDKAFVQMAFTERPDGHPETLEHREYKTPTEHSFDICTTCEGSPVSDCSSCDATGTSECERCNDGAVPCSPCEGTGALTCPVCKGDVTVECETCDGDGHLSQSVPCSSCDSSGSIRSRETCTNCQGKGSLTDADGESVRCPNCRGRSTVSVTRACTSCNGAGEQTIQSGCPDCAMGRVDCEECDDGEVWCRICEESGTRECSDCEGTTEVSCRSCDGIGTLTCETCTGDGETHQYVLVHDAYTVKTEETQFGSLPHGIEAAEWEEFDACSIDADDGTVRREVTPSVAAIREVRYDYGEQTFNLRQMGGELYYTRLPEPKSEGLFSRLRGRFTG